MSRLALLLSLIWYHVSSLSMSENRLTWTDANQYCIDHCSSTMVSLHTDTEYLQILNDIIPNSVDISAAFSSDNLNAGYWIGLNKLSSSNLEWYDGTTLNFGSVYGAYPWQSNQPSQAFNEKCVHLKNTDGYKWHDISCTVSEMRFICNNCKGKLEKYVIIQETMSWSNAQSFCSTNIGTSLATVHSQTDQDDIKTLCSIHNDHCWIGLSDSNSESNWEWDDGSTFDYGTNAVGGVTSGQYPWATSPDDEPNGGTGENCVELNADKSYRWNDELCSKNRYFICNMPSEICISDNWKIMQNAGVLSWNNCVMSSEYNSTAIINKQWLYTNDLWLIEYIYTINNVFGVYGESGISIYHFNTVCDYYYVGIVVDSNLAYLFIYSYIDNVKTQIYYSDALFTYEFGKYYVLEIILFYTTEIIWNVYINDVQYITDATSQINSAYLTHYKYVGIENKDITITAKSLFISETPRYVFTDSQLNKTWLQCISSPTNPPTMHPTKYPTKTSIPPTKNPSNNPSLPPTHIPSILPTNYPSNNPTNYPSNNPTDYPSYNPSKFPTNYPSYNPSISPTNYPSNYPSVSPTNFPSYNPSNLPTVSPLEEGQVGSVSSTQINKDSDNNITGNIRNEISNEMLDLLIILISCFICCCCVILLTLISIRYRMKKATITEESDATKRNNLSKQIYETVEEKRRESISTIQMTTVQSLFADAKIRTRTNTLDEVFHSQKKSDDEDEDIYDSGFTTPQIQKNIMVMDQDDVDGGGMVTICNDFNDNNNTKGGHPPTKGNDF